MKTHYLVVALLGTSCYHLQESSTKPTGSGSESKEPNEPVVVTPANCPPTPVKVRCKVSPPPDPPHVVWAPKDCPVGKFGACLSKEDLVLLTKYLRAVDEWSDTAYDKCVEGK